MFCSKCMKMSNIINKFLLAGNKFMPEMLLRQSGFMYSDCGPITKNQNKNTKFKTKTENSRYIYWNELQKTCFKHDMVYGDFKVLIRRTASDKVLHAAFAIASNLHCDGYQGGLASVVYKFSDTKTGHTGTRVSENQQFNNELHKPIIRNFKKR